MFFALIKCFVAWCAGFGLAGLIKWHSDKMNFVTQMILTFAVYCAPLFVWGKLPWYVLLAYYLAVMAGFERDISVEKEIESFKKENK